MYKRGKVWWINYTLPDGTHRYESSGTSNKQLAKKLQDMRRGAIAEGRLRLPRSNPPFLEPYSDGFLETIKDPKTKARYLSSVRNLVSYFGRIKLSQITSEGIEGFKQARLEQTVTPATINRDLAVLRRMLKLATLQRLISYNPMDEVEFLEERKQRRQPQILTFEEERRLLEVASPQIGLLVVLIVETGLRVGKEVFPLEWKDVDILSKVVTVRVSKTVAGRRSVPLSEYCKGEVIKWRELVGPDFSRYVFPNLKNPSAHVKSVKKGWATTLKLAGIDFFPIYNLRATFASRLSAAGEADLFVAQMMGHSTPSILQTYAKVIDEYRRNAIHKLEVFRQTQDTETNKSHPSQIEKQLGRVN